MAIRGVSPHIDPKNNSHSFNGYFNLLPPNRTSTIFPSAAKRISLESFCKVAHQVSAHNKKGKARSYPFL